MARQRPVRPEEIIRQIGQGKVAAAYLLTGTEPYLVAEVVQAVRDAVLPEGSTDWNADRLAADEAGGQTVVLRCNTPPLGSDRRLVQVQGIEAWSEKDHAPVIEYLGRPAASTVLLLTGKKVDARTRLARAVEAAGVVARFDTLRERDVPERLVQMAQRQNKKLSPEAAQQLIGRCGVGLQTLANEVEKLALFVGEAGEITAADVAEAAAGEGTANVFALCDAVFAGDEPRALTLLDGELTAGDRSGPIRVTLMLARHVRLLIRARFSRGNLAAELGLPPFIADQYGRQARKLSTDALLRAHDRIYETDGHLKGGSRLPPVQLVERLLIDLCALAGAPGGAGVRPARV